MTQVRCKAKNREGEPCGAVARESGFCIWHDPDRADDIARWRAQGGANRSNAARAKKAAEQAAPQDMTDVDRVLRQAMAATLAETMPARTATALAALARAIEAIRGTAEVEQRLAALESWIKEQPA